MTFLLPNMPAKAVIFHILPYSYNYSVA